MTLTEVLERSIIRAGLTETSAGDLNTARIYANSVIQDIASRATWWWLFKEGTITTVASTRAYALATDVLTPLSFRDTSNNQTLSIKSSDDMDAIDPDQSETNDPQWVVLTGANATTGAPQVDLHPTPSTSSDTIKYRYFKYIPEWTTANDSQDLFTIHGIPILLHQALYNGIAALIQVEMGDDSGAGINRSEMERIIRQALAVNGRMSGNGRTRMTRQRDNAFKFDFTIREGSLT